MRHICEQLKVNDTMNKDNVINFSGRSKEAQENFPQTPIPTASDVAYYTNSLIRKDYTPIAVQAYKERLRTNESSWLDYLTVMLGVPSYVDCEAQLDELEIPTLEIPFGMVMDLAFVTNIDFNVVVPFEDTEGLIQYLHISLENFEYMARVKRNALNQMYSPTDVHNRKQFIVSLFLEQREQDEKETLLNVILAEGATRLNELDLIELYTWARITFDAENYFYNFSDFYNSVIHIVDLHPVDLLHDKRIIYANDVVARTSNDNLVTAIESEVSN
jgi:hypothetical protein